jgi:hypothetical protein
MNADDRTSRWNAVDVALAALSSLTFLYAWIYYPISQGLRGDFFALLSHRDDPSPYWNGQGIGYGPIFALYDLMLRPFHDRAAMLLMYAVNITLVTATFVLLIRVFLPAPRTRRELLLALFIWSSFYPLAQLVRQNNIEITELFFLALFLLYLTRDQQYRAGIALGLATSAKLVPIFLVPYLLWRRRWKTALLAITTLIVMLAGVAALKGLGPAAAIDNWRHAASAHWDNEWNNNQAFSGFFWRFFSEPSFTSDVALAYPHVMHESWARIATMSTALLAMLGTAVVFIRRAGIWPSTANADIEATELVIVFTVILLCLPHSHTHYFGLVVWIYFIALRAMLRDDPPLPARAQWMFVLSYVLAGLLIPLRLADPIIRRRLPVSLVEISKLYSLPLIGIVLAVLATFVVHRIQLRRQPLGT